MANTSDELVPMEKFDFDKWEKERQWLNYHDEGFLPPVAGPGPSPDPDLDYVSDPDSDKLHSINEKK